MRIAGVAYFARGSDASIKDALLEDGLGGIVTIKVDG